MDGRDIATQIIQDHKHLESARYSLDSQCREIAQRIWPAHSDLFGAKNVPHEEGQKRTEYVFDSSPMIALNRFGAILDSLLTPRNQTWHRLLPSDSNLLKDRATKLWFEQVNRALFKFRYAPLANFAAQNQMNYKSLGAYGTGCMFIDQLDGEPGIRYKNIHLSELYLKENHQGIVDGVHRYYAMKARQVIQRWGDNAPERIKSAVKTNPEQEFFFIHCVKPRGEYDPGYDPERIDFRGMKYASYYISVEGQELIEEGGYTTLPHAVSRYEQTEGETYGRSPAMDCLPAIKTLNEQKKVVLKQGHRTVDPVILGADDGVLKAMSLRPGALVPGGVSRDGKMLIHPLPVGRVDIGKDLMDYERAVINDAFLVTLFQILVDSPQRTATEVMELAKEKGMLLAPTTGRQQSEYLGAMVDREVDLLSRQKLLPPMPPALLEAGGEYRVEYDSPLSRAQRAEEASGLMRTVETTLGIVNVTQDPAPLDHFDWDIIVPEISEIQGVPSRWMRDPKVVAAMRAQRAEAAQAQQEIQAAPGTAAIIKSTAIARQGG